MAAGVAADSLRHWLFGKLNVLCGKEPQIYASYKIARFEFNTNSNVAPDAHSSGKPEL